jgi:hypothetical protein
LGRSERDCMNIEEHVFNKRYSDKWLRFFVPWPSRRNLKMGMNFLVSKLQLSCKCQSCIATLTLP